MLIEDKVVNWGHKALNSFVSILLDSANMVLKVYCLDYMVLLPTDLDRS
jgi:hypothetical protein